MERVINLVTPWTVKRLHLHQMAINDNAGDVTCYWLKWSSVSHTHCSHTKPSPGNIPCTFDIGCQRAEVESLLAGAELRLVCDRKTLEALTRCEEYSSGMNLHCIEQCIVYEFYLFWVILSIVGNMYLKFNLKRPAVRDCAAKAEFLAFSWRLCNQKFSVCFGNSIRPARHS